jgi:hypothetical protein
LEYVNDVGTSDCGAVMFEELAGQGNVVGGHFINGTVAIGYRGDLVVQPGLKRRKLVAAEAAAREDITGEAGTGSGAPGAVSRIVAGAVLPGLVGKVAGAALDATFGSAGRPPRTIRVDWNDGKQSLIRLPAKLLTHLTVVFADRQTVAPATAPAIAAADLPPAPTAHIMEQIAKLAVLQTRAQSPTRSSWPRRLSCPHVSAVAPPFLVPRGRRRRIAGVSCGVLGGSREDLACAPRATTCRGHSG